MGMTINKGAQEVAALASQAMAVADGFGGAMMATAASAAKWYKGEEIPKPDMTFILASVSAERGWDSLTSGDQRRSELKQLIGQYSKLSEALPAIMRDAPRPPNLKQVVQLARSLKKLPVADAVAAFTTNKAGAKPTRMTAKVKRGRVIAALNVAIKYAEPAVRDALLDVCKAHGIAVNANRDAKAEEPKAPTAAKRKSAKGK